MSRYTFPILSIIFILSSLNSSHMIGDEKREDEVMPEFNKVQLKNLPFSATIWRLENGLTVTMIPYNSSGLVSYYTAMRVGSRDEIEAGHSGFAHLFEHMMFRGTKKMPGKEYDDAVTGMGADSSAWTWNDQTVYFFIAPSEKLPRVIEMEAERFKNLYYTEDDFKTEAGAVLGEYNKNFSNPLNKLEEVLWEKAFSKHTYRHTTMGFLEDIRKMPERYEYSLKFFKRHYHPKNANIFIVGDFDEEETISLIKKHYSDWQGAPFETKPEVEPPQTEERRYHLFWDKDVLPKMLIGYKVPAFSDSSKISASLVLAGELLFGETSELFDRLVLKEQKIEDIGYWEWHLRDPGLFILQIDLKDEDYDYVISSIDSVISSIKEGGIDENKIVDIRSHYLYSILLELDTSKVLAEKMAFFSTLTGNPLTLDNYLQRVKEITTDDVLDVIRKFFKPLNRTIVTLSYKKGGESMKNEEDAK